MKYAIAVLVCLSLIVGCTKAKPKANIPGRVPYVASLDALIGEWDSEGELALIVKRVGNELVVDNPQNDTVRVEISECSSTENSISFTQHHPMQDGSPNLFSDVACRCTIKTVEGNKDQMVFTISAPEIPQESDVYSRRK